MLSIKQKKHRRPYAIFAAAICLISTGVYFMMLTLSPSVAPLIFTKPIDAKSLPKAKIGENRIVILLRREMPAEAVLRTRLNGRVVQEARLGEMIFGVPRIIAHISRFATLRAGDVIATGTPSGVGPVHDGDTVEVEIEGIGVLRNRFVGSED